MTSIPWELLEDFVKGDDIKHAGVGMFFLSQVPVPLPLLRLQVEMRGARPHPQLRAVDGRCKVDSCIFFGAGQRRCCEVDGARVE